MQIMGWILFLLLYLNISKSNLYFDLVNIEFEDNNIFITLRKRM